MEIDLTGLVLPRKVEADVSEDGRVGSLVIDPLERGYGHTLGNSIRRALLASLQGSAVWGFRIDGVVHEHQTIPDVVEDVHQVIQNLKSLVVALDDDIDEATLTLRAETSGPVTAGQIEPPAGVKILDPEHHLFTLEDDRELNIELYVNKGRGFVLSEQHPLPKRAPVDLVRIDSIYNPVRRANFQVDETRVGQRTDFDRLTLKVETDGSVGPVEAVEYAAQLLKTHLDYFGYFAEESLPAAPRAGSVAVPERLVELFDKEIDDLVELTVRSRNSLKKARISKVGELVRKTREDMMGIENFGEKSLEEIEHFLDEHGLRLGLDWVESEEGKFYFAEEEGAGSAG